MFDDVQRIAREAGSLAADYFTKLGNVAVESKGHLDLVTEADRQVERLIGERLEEAFPDDGIFGEEGAARQTSSGRIWVVDPIDGTFNYLRGSDQWAVSIGLYEAGQPRFGVVYAPLRDEFLVGGEGFAPTLNGNPLAARSGFDRSRAVCDIGFHPSIPAEEQLGAFRFVIDEAGMTFRCTGSAITALIDVGRGQVDGYFGLGISTWDLMAMLPILKHIGITSTLDWNSIKLQDKLRFVCGTPEFIDVFSSHCPAGSR